MKRVYLRVHSFTFHLQYRKNASYKDASN
jgi:hypothetical protein